jgi:hypothetical protein
MRGASKLLIHSQVSTTNKSPEDAQGARGFLAFRYFARGESGTICNKPTFVVLPLRIFSTHNHQCGSVDHLDGPIVGQTSFHFSTKSRIAVFWRIS